MSGKKFNYELFREKGNAGSPPPIGSSKPYDISETGDICVKNWGLFALLFISMVYGVVIRFSLYGLIATLILAVLLFYFGCMQFPEKKIPAQSIKFKTPHFFFYPVAARCAVHIFHAPDKYRTALSNICSSLLEDIGVFLCIAVMIALMIFSKSIANPKYGKFVRYAGIAVMLEGIVRFAENSVILCVTAIVIPLLYFLMDFSMNDEAEYFSKQPMHIRTNGILYAVLSGILLIFTIAPDHIGWNHMFLAMLGSRFTFLRFMYLLLSGIVMLAVCMVFTDGTKDGLHNNECSIFLFTITFNVLLWIAVKVPMERSYLIHAAYVLLSIPACVCYGRKDVVGWIERRTRIAPFHQHLAVSVACVVCYFSIHAHLPITTMMMAALAVLWLLLCRSMHWNRNLLIRHGIPVTVFLLYLGICFDVTGLSVKMLITTGLLLILMNAGLCYFDYQDRHLRKAREQCLKVSKQVSASTKEFAENQIAFNKYAGYVLVGGYVLMMLALTARYFN